MRKMPSLFGRDLRSAFVAAVLLGLAGCAATPEEDEDYVERPVDELYNMALDNLQNGDPQQAARDFEEVQRQHPYSQWATRAELMSAFAFYEANQYDEAVAAAQRFIELHPGNDDVPYAYYLIGIAYYEQISDVGRDQRTTRQALQAFDDLVGRFPDTPYARDARLKADLARDHLAGKEMEIGRYYLRRSEYIGAINRFNNVIENYQTTTHVPEALHRLTEAYLALGVDAEAERTAAVLGANFPGSRWYQDSYGLLVDGAPTSDGVPYWNGAAADEDGTVPVREQDEPLSERRTIFDSLF
jgi:outer membrane protein assembly factor BamD